MQKEPSRCRAPRLKVFLSSLVLFLVLCLTTSCGTLTGIPAHGGGKRFATEQRLISASIRGALKEIDLSPLAGKRAAIVFDLISDEGGGNMSGGRISLGSALSLGYLVSPTTTTASTFQIFNLADATSSYSNTGSSSGSSVSTVTLSNGTTAGQSINSGTTATDSTSSGSNTSSSNSSSSSTDTSTTNSSGTTTDSSTTNTTGNQTNQGSGSNTTTTGGIQTDGTYTENGSSNSSSTSNTTASGSSTDTSTTTGSGTTTSSSTTSGSQSSTSSSTADHSEQTDSSGSSTNNSRTDQSSGTGSTTTTVGHSNSTRQEISPAPSKTTTETKGTKFDGSVSLAYRGLGEYQNFNVPKSDASLLMGLVRNYLLLNGVIPTTPTDKDADVLLYVTVDIFGIVRSRFDTFVYNHERVKAETSFEMMAFDRTGKMIMAPTTSNEVAEYTEHYLFWAGPLNTREKVHEGEGLLIDFSDLANQPQGSGEEKEAGKEKVVDHLFGSN